MLKRTVPTLVKIVPAANVSGLKANTSRSGRLNLTALFQFRARRSSQRLLLGLNLTMRPVSGPVMPSGMFALGAGSPPGYVVPAMLHDPTPEPPLQTTPSLTVVVRLPDWKTAT